MEAGIEQRFEQYSNVIAGVLGHADRVAPARWYMKGLMLPGERKSVEPMAARVAPENVRAAHQSMHHLVAKSEWSDAAVLGAVAGQVVPKLLKKDAQCWWIVDDTGHAKKGSLSVGVARQYLGRLGKTENGQVAVSLSLANMHGSVPLAYGLYLPEEWTDDPKRCAAAGVPEGLEFRTKGEIAREQIEAALAQELPRGTVLGDAAYGNESAFRDWLTERKLRYVLAVRETTSVWWGKHQPVQAAANDTPSRGRTRTRLKRDAEHQPISVLALARQLPAQSWRTITWREGTKKALHSRFARVRVRAANQNQPRAQEWLLIEWPTTEDAPLHYWLSTLPKSTSFQQLVANTMGRWMIERDYQELKSELGLSHYEGRNWRGFHHHATLCIAAYGFLMLERLSGKKNSARFAEPAVPREYRARGSRSDAASPTVVDPQHPLPARARHRSDFV